MAMKPMIPVPSSPMGALTRRRPLLTLKPKKVKRFDDGGLVERDVDVASVDALGHGAISNGGGFIGSPEMGERGAPGDPNISSGLIDAQNELDGERSFAGKVADFALGPRGLSFDPVTGQFTAERDWGRTAIEKAAPMMFGPLGPVVSMGMRAGNAYGTPRDNLDPQGGNTMRNGGRVRLAAGGQPDVAALIQAAMAGRGRAGAGPMPQGMPPGGGRQMVPQGGSPTMPSNEMMQAPMAARGGAGASPSSAMPLGRMTPGGMQRPMMPAGGMPQSGAAPRRTRLAEGGQPEVMAMIQQAMQASQGGGAPPGPQGQPGMPPGAPPMPPPEPSPLDFIPPAEELVRRYGGGGPQAIAEAALAGGGRPGSGTRSGLLRGPGGGRSDAISAELEPDGFVYTANRVKEKGRGSTERGAAKIAEEVGNPEVAEPIATVQGGSVPAKVSNGEVYLSRADAARAGGASALEADLRPRRRKGRRR